jgi:hypothetical protein
MAGDLESARDFIESSPAAARVQAAGSDQAAARHREARALLEQARQAQARGDQAGAQELLRDANRRMLEATQLAAQARPEQGAARFESRLASVKALRDALGRLGGGGNRAAVQEIDQTVAGAERLAAARDYPAATAALDRAYALAQSGNVRQRDGTEEVAGKRFASEQERQQFEQSRTLGEQSREDPRAALVQSRIGSVRALRDALQRLGGTGGVLGRVDQALSQAERLASTGDYEQALATLEGAYRAVQTGNVERRDGTEQVASKQFASPEEELRYELARNDDYHSLGSALAAGQGAEMKALMEPGLRRGRELRGSAETSAAAGAFDAALRAVEASTLEYKKGLRAAGLPIP